MARNPHAALAVLALLLHAPLAMAEDATDEADSNASAPTDYPQVSTDLALGYLQASGNTESSSTNLDLETKVEYARWRHTLVLNGFRSSENGEQTAQRYSGRLQTDYHLTERTYLFLAGRYERTRFGAFDRRASLIAGAGRRFVDTEDVTLDLEAGAGRRVSEPAGTNERNGMTVGLLRGDFAWQFSETSALTQELEVTAGPDNTSTHSKTALESDLTGTLSLVVSYTIEHNSDVPPDREKTDTFTAVSLQYGF